MEPDLKRGRGQWKGCHTFEDIICDSDGTAGPKRNGGLKMGQQYWYYYEVDGSTETHNPSLPSTTACPYLPGQQVNTLEVPVQRASRLRSASASAVGTMDLKTMRPSDKYVTPRAPPVTPIETPLRLDTAPQPRNHIRSSRSISPLPSFPLNPRKFFTRKASSRNDEEVGSPLPVTEEVEEQVVEKTVELASCGDTIRSEASSRSGLLRSPTSLRRFLQDDRPTRRRHHDAPKDAVVIPSDFADMDDDENFATSAPSTASEAPSFTVLSPPPPRSASPAFSAFSQLPPRLERLSTDGRRSLTSSSRSSIQSTTLLQMQPPRSHLSFSSASSIHSPLSPGSAGLPSIYHSETEDDDIPSANDDDAYPFPSIAEEISDEINSETKSQYVSRLTSKFAGYSLPSSTADDTIKNIEVTSPVEVQVVEGSPLLVASDAELPATSSTSPVAPTLPMLPAVTTDVGSLLSELGWIADVIDSHKTS